MLNIRKNLTSIKLYTKPSSRVFLISESGFHTIKPGSQAFVSRCQAFVSRYQSFMSRNQAFIFLNCALVGMMGSGLGLGVTFQGITDPRR